MDTITTVVILLVIYAAFEGFMLLKVRDNVLDRVNGYVERLNEFQSTLDESIGEMSQTRDILRSDVKVLHSRLDSLKNVVDTNTALQMTDSSDMTTQYSELLLEIAALKTRLEDTNRVLGLSRLRVVELESAQAETSLRLEEANKGILISADKLQALEEKSSKVTPNKKTTTLTRKVAAKKRGK